MISLDRIHLYDPHTYLLLYALMVKMQEQKCGKSIKERLVRKDDEVFDMGGVGEEVEGFDFFDMVFF